MIKRITACLLAVLVFFYSVPVPVSAAECYNSHFESSEEKMLDRYYGTSLDGLGEHAAILSPDADDTYEADVDSALLIDASDNEVLASYHAFDRVYPASTTKVLTALITLEQCQMTEEVVIKNDITFDESGVVAVGFKKGDKVYKLLDFTRESKDIADPWYTNNFEITYNEIDKGCRGLLEFLMSLSKNE